MYKRLRICGIAHSLCAEICSCTPSCWLKLANLQKRWEVVWHLLTFAVTPPCLRRFASIGRRLLHMSDAQQGDWSILRAVGKSGYNSPERIEEIWDWPPKRATFATLRPSLCTSLLDIEWLFQIRGRFLLCLHQRETLLVSTKRVRSRLPW